MLQYAIFGANGTMGGKLIEASSKFLNQASLKKMFVSSQFFVKQRGNNYHLFSLKEVENLNFIIDFSTPEASLHLAKTLSGTDTLIVCGTTGFSQKQFQELTRYSEQVKILYSANFSLGVNKFFEAVKNLALVLNEYEVEILEKHHSLKKDAPSGTAIEIGKIIAQAKKQDFESIKSIDRNHLRKPEEIGFSSIRQGKINGFHEVSFCNQDERIWIGHEAFNKNIFAEGALEIAIKAYIKLKKEAFGLFSINDINNL